MFLKKKYIHDNFYNFFPFAALNKLTYSDKQKEAFKEYLSNLKYVFFYGMKIGTKCFEDKKIRITEKNKKITESGGKLKNYRVAGWVLMSKREQHKEVPIGSFVDPAIIMLIKQVHNNTLSILEEFYKSANYYHPKLERFFKGKALSVEFKDIIITEEHLKAYKALSHKTKEERKKDEESEIASYIKNLISKVTIEIGVESTQVKFIMPKAQQTRMNLLNEKQKLVEVIVKDKKYFLELTSLFKQCKSEHEDLMKTFTDSKFKRKIDEQRFMSEIKKKEKECDGFSSSIEEISSIIELNCSKMKLIEGDLNQIDIDEIIICPKIREYLPNEDLNIIYEKMFKISLRMILMRKAQEDNYNKLKKKLLSELNELFAKKRIAEYRKTFLYVDKEIMDEYLKIFDEIDSVDFVYIKDRLIDLDMRKLDKFFSIRMIAKHADNRKWEVLLRSNEAEDKITYLNESLDKYLKNRTVDVKQGNKIRYQFLSFVYKTEILPYTKILQTIFSRTHGSLTDFEIIILKKTNFILKSILEASELNLDSIVEEIGTLSDELDSRINKTVCEIYTVYICFLYNYGINLTNFYDENFKEKEKLVKNYISSIIDDKTSYAMSRFGISKSKIAESFEDDYKKRSTKNFEFYRPFDAADDIKKIFENNRLSNYKIKNDLCNYFETSDLRQVEKDFQFRTVSGSTIKFETRKKWIFLEFGDPRRTFLQDNLGVKYINSFTKWIDFDFNILKERDEKCKKFHELSDDLRDFTCFSARMEKKVFTIEAILTRDEYEKINLLTKHLNIDDVVVSPKAISQEKCKSEFKNNSYDRIFKLLFDDNSEKIKEKPKARISIFRKKTLSFEQYMKLRKKENKLYRTALGYHVRQNLDSPVMKSILEQESDFKKFSFLNCLKMTNKSESGIKILEAKISLEISCISGLDLATRIQESIYFQDSRVQDMKDFTCTI